MKGFIINRIKVAIVKETQKALLVAAGERQGWIQKRWMNVADNSVAAETFERAIASYDRRQADYKEAKEWSSSLHKIKEIARETEKAVAVNVNFDAYNIERNFARLLWIPKSLIKDGYAPGWFIAKKIYELADELSEQIHTGVLCDFIAIEDCDRLF